MDDYDDCFNVDFSNDPVRAWMMAKWWTRASGALMAGEASFNRGVGCAGMGTFGGCSQVPPDEVEP